MNEQTTYAYIGEKRHFINGRYTLNHHYVCLKDHSLLDTQILLVDDDGESHWEHIYNFECDLTPYLATVDYEYHINHYGDTLPFREQLVWYEEKTFDELEEFLNKRSRYQITLKSIVRG